MPAVPSNVTGRYEIDVDGGGNIEWPYSHRSMDTPRMRYYFGRR